MKQPTIIFDFDGTIANTLESIIDIMNEVSEEFRFSKIPKIGTLSVHVSAQGP